MYFGSRLWIFAFLVGLLHQERMQIFRFSILSLKQRRIEEHLYKIKVDKISYVFNWSITTQQIWNSKPLRKSYRFCYEKMPFYWAIGIVEIKGHYLYNFHRSFCTRSAFNRPTISSHDLISHKLNLFRLQFCVNSFKSGLTPEV